MRTAYIMKIIQDFITFYEKCHHTNNWHGISTSHGHWRPTASHRHGDDKTCKLNQRNCLHNMELNWGPAEHRSKAWTVQQDHVMALLLVPGLSLWRPGFNLRSVHVWHVAFRVAVELVFVWLFWCAVSVIHSSITDTLYDNSNCQSS